MAVRLFQLQLFKFRAADAQNLSLGQMLLYSSSPNLNKSISRAYGLLKPSLLDFERGISFMTKWLGVLVLIFSLHSIVWAGPDQPKDDWSPEREIPRFTFVGEVSSAEKHLADILRQKMIHQLEYAKEAGLPNPPDLDSMIYIGTYDGMRFQDYLHLMNPHIKNIPEDAARQFEDYKSSNLYTFLSKMEESMQKGDKGGAALQKLIGKQGSSLPELVFDFFAKLRYGAFIPHFIERLQANEILTHEIVAKLDLGEDNAYFGRFFDFNISDVLTQRQEGKPVPLDKMFNLKGIAKAFKSKRPILKIVILPRTTQQVGDLELTTLKDPSVVLHEQGHFQNFTAYGDGGQFDRSLDEAVADYIAASSENDPKIGAWFAQVSQVVADRLKAEGSNPENDKLIAAMERIADKKVLRDLSKIQTIDDLPRFYSIAEEHGAADPVRTILWQTRTSLSPDEQLEFDHGLIRAIHNFSEIPDWTSTRLDVYLGFRSIYAKLRELVKAKWGEKVLEGKLGRAPNPAEKAELAKQIREKRESTEAKAKAAFQRDKYLGSKQAPPIPSDYVLPEFARALYSELLASPRIAKIFRWKAERALDAKSYVFETKGGRKSLMLVSQRTSWLDPITKVKLQRSFEKIEFLKDQIRAARQAIQQMESSDVDAAASELQLNGLLKTFTAELEHVQEYQRTGSMARAFTPHPTLTVLQVSAKIGGKAVMAVVSALKKDKSDGGKGALSGPAKEDCTTELEKL